MSNNKRDDIEGFSDKFASKIYPGFMQAEPKWGPIGKHNYEGHYSRIKRDGKYEEWRDTTIRVVDGNLGFVPKKYHEPNERESLLKLIYEFSQMPAGRHLWVTGVPGRQFINNCLQGDTKVLTRLGWKKIRDLAGTEQEIVTDEGKWVKASFKSFGVQNLCKVTYKEPQSDETYEVYATPGHDWVVEDSKKCRLPKVKTSDLKEGMRLPVVNGRSNGLEYLSPQGIQHGIVFGDGCCTEHDCHVDLFGDSFVYLDKYFPDNRKSDVTQLGQVGSRISGMPSYFKKLPDLSENKPYLLGFLAGWIAADGGIRNTSVCLFNKSKEVLEHAKSIAAICGIRSSSPRKDREGTEYKQDSELWYITFNSCDRADKLLIREDHKHKLVIPKSPRSKKYCIVQSVEETNRYEEVFCAEVPETHNFVIEGNVLTGNCFTSGWVYDRPSEHSAFLFMRLMEGGGVGSNYSNQYIEKLPFICSVPEVHFVCSPEHPDYPSMKEYLSNPADGGYAYEWQFSHQIEDSREGWREALVMMMDNFYKAHPAPLIFDLSHVRKAGAIIKSFGGTASGPLYLLMMLRQVHAVMSNAFGRKLTSLEWMLIDHYIAVCVVSGGTRRSARMSMKYWKDFDIIDFIKCKTDGMSHWTTNISVIVDNEFFRAYKAGDPHARNIMFLVSYYAIKNGEPGFFNIDLARVGEADPELMFSTNPCGEIAMEMWDVCNLGHINMANFIHKRSKMYEAARLMTRFLIRATYGDIADPKSRAVVDKNRRIGVGLMGYHNWLVGHGIKYSRSWESSFVKQTLRDMKEVVDREAFSYAHQLRIPVPVKRTTLAPTGTISLIPGVVSSAQSDIFNHFERRVIYNPNDPNHARILEEHIAAGGIVEDSIYSPGMKVAVSLCKSTLTEYCEENNCTDLLEDSRTISPEDMMSVQAMFQEYWADNAISYTVNFPLDYVEKFHKNSMGMLEPVWDGIEDKVEAHAKEIERLLIQFGPRLKGTTLMPDISNRPQPPFTYLTREQYEEGTTVRAIADSESTCLNGACPIK